VHLHLPSFLITVEATELPAAGQSSMPTAHLWPIPRAPGTATSAATSMVYLLAHPSLTVMGISDLAAITDKHLTTLETLGPLPLAVSVLQETKEMGSSLEFGLWKVISSRRQKKREAGGGGESRGRREPLVYRNFLRAQRIHALVFSPQHAVQRSPSPSPCLGARAVARRRTRQRLGSYCGSRGG